MASAIPSAQSSSAKAFQLAPRPPVSRALATLICHPLSGGKTLRNVEEVAVYLQAFPLDEMPDSVKNLFHETIFASSADQALDALQGGKTHVLFEVDRTLLLAWEKTNDFYTLTVFTAPEGFTEVPPCKGGLFSWLFAYKHALQDSSLHEMLSEWKGSKNKIDPLAASYQNLPASIFSKKWLEAFQNGSDPLTLLAPLKSYAQPQAPLPASNDEAGWLSRFSTSPIGRNPAYWLYKQWMKRHLPLQDYRLFHFQHRLRLLDQVEPNLQGEANAKLLRSLAKKGRESIERTLGCKQALLEREAPERTPRQREKISIAPQSLESRRVNVSSDLDRSRFIWREPVDPKGKEEEKDSKATPPILQEREPPLAIEDFERKLEENGGDLGQTTTDLFKGVQGDPKAFFERVLFLAKKATKGFRSFWSGCLEWQWNFPHPREYEEYKKITKELSTLAGEQENAIPFSSYNIPGRSYEPSCCFNEESSQMAGHTDRFPSLLGALKAVPYIAPECILREALDLLRHPLNQAENFFHYQLNRFFAEAFMTEEIQTLQEKAQDKNISQEDKEALLLQAMALREKSTVLPWMQLLDDPSRRPFVEAFLAEAVSILQKSQDDICTTLTGLMLFSARLASYQKDLIVPDFEPLVCRLQRDTSSLQRNRILCLRTLLFWIAAEKGDLRRAQMYRPREKDGWQVEKYDSRPWSFSDAERIRAWVEKIPEEEEQSSLEAATFDWSKIVSNIERKLAGRIDPASWNMTSSTTVSCIIQLDSGWRKEMKIRREGSYHYIFWDDLQLSRAEHNQTCTQLNHRKKLPLPLSDLLVGEERDSGTFWLIQKSTGKKLGLLAQEMTFEHPEILSGYWWDGEPIELTNDSCLKEIPSLRWQEAAEGQIHNHELVDKKTDEVKKHVFHLPPLEGDRLASFAIDYANGCYKPKNLEEQLCLLHVYLEIEDLEKVHEIIQSLPLMTHALSQTSVKMIRALLGISAAKRNSSFAHLQLTMQMLTIFYRWLENPSFAHEHSESLLLLLRHCFHTWQLYQNAHQNGHEHLLLSHRERKNLNERQLSLFDFSPLARLDGIIVWVMKKLFSSQTPPTIENIAWPKVVRLDSPDFEEQFARADQKLSMSPHGKLSALHEFSRSILGRKYILPGRAEELSAFEEQFQEFAISAPLSEQEIAHKRLALSADLYRSPYAAHLLDYALEKRILRKEGESFGEFLARLEQAKYTKNIVTNLAEGIYSLVSRIVSQIAQILRALPMTVQPFMSSFRSPFTLADRSDDLARTIDETIPLLQEPYQRAPENREQAQIRADILRMANQMDPLRAEKLKMHKAEEITWSHLEGLFVRNAMHRLEKINEALSTKDCQKLDQWMHSYYLASKRTDYQYNPHELTDTVRAFLILESITGMTIRRDQIEKLEILLSSHPESGKYRTLAMQMGMGGGKTSVLASIALLLAAKPGRIALLIPLASQFSSLAYDFPRWQKERFQQEIIPIHVEPKLLSEIKTLEWIKKQLHLAKTEGHGLLVHPDTLSHLQLLWRSSSDRALLKIALEIRQELLENGDALLDEVDKMIYPLKDTSMAVGPEKTLSKTYISHFRNVIELHQKHPIIWQALERNRPQQIDLEEYKKFQRDEIGEALVEETFSIPAEHKESCKRYLVGEASEREDQAFLAWLDQNPQKDLINLHNHWLEDVLRHAIFKERGRHYGRKEEKAAIVSYDGVGSPSNRKFAQPGEEASYYFLNIMSDAYTEELLKEILENYRGLSSVQPLLRAKIDAKVHRLFGFSLSELKNLEIFQEALRRVNQNPMARLELEEYFIRRHVVYYEHQITSTSQSFLSMFSTYRGFSGTFPQFIYDFDHAVEADLDADRRVKQAILDHNEPVLASDSPPDTFFADLHRKTGPISGLIDMGARFKDFSNEEVARKVLEQLGHIEHVLFFGKASEGDETADTPMLLSYDRKTSTFHRHIVKSTKKEVLASWGVNSLERLFVYFDERHCEAVDVEQLMNGTNICTFGIHTSRRDLFQGVMRMRNYRGEKDPSTHQSALFVLDSDTKKFLFGSADYPATTEELIQKAEEIEAQEISICSPRTYYHAIDAAFFQAAEELLPQFIDNPKKLSLLQSFFLYLVVDPSPSKQFGGVYVTEDSYAYFQNLIEKRKAELKRIYPGGVLPKTLLQKLDKINENLKRALEETRHLASQISYKQKPFQVGQEQQQRQRQEQQQEQETKAPRAPARPKEGKVWTEQKNPKHCDLASHYTTKSWFSSLLSSSHLISESFDSKLLEGIQATENWLHTYTFTHAMNHPAQKMAYFILLEKKGEKIVPTILSLYDYQEYIRNPKTLPPLSCVCLTLPFEEKSPTPCLLGSQWSPDLFAGQEDRLKKLWIQLAFINADPFYILSHLQDLGEPITGEHLNFLKERVKHWREDFWEDTIWKEKQDVDRLIFELEEMLLESNRI